MNSSSPDPDPDVDLVIVGAGFAGLYMLHAARGIGLSARVIEAGSGVGGTWYWNRYPGARCDVPSMEYSLGFDDDLQREWEWTERYPTQPEILRYIEHVADRFDLRDGITFDTRVQAAHFDDATSTWTTITDGGESIRSRFVVMATGCLSAANLPQIPGRDDFAGPTYHTGHWPHEGVDFTGKRVAVVGTGSSAIQSIPLIAEQAAHVTVFQRTPAYAVPAHNRPLDPDEVARIKADYVGWRAAARDTTTGFGGHLRADPEELPSALEVDEETRRRTYEERWEVGGLTFLGAFNDLLFSPEANDTAAEFVRSKIRDIVEDPAVADRLSPDTVIGCKRMCVDTGYYATFNRDNVDLVDVGATPIERITSTGVEVDGTVHEVDAIVFATGFDAMTGALDRIDIRGRGGVPLKEKWSAGPLTYLGLQVNGFPNLFTITGPGSPSVLTNMVVSIEQHVEWIRDLLARMDAEGTTTVEADADAEAEWVAYVNAVAELTLFHGCSSWYLGANVPGKPRVFMPLPGFPDYKAKCDEVAAADYEGFILA
ncbi:MAG: NAD(P)/FAD-dependent oxidoreductase [Acidimicrobiales bacterium]|nr:NAD(P)/FAD-dependent oxidoreductase [Acidimicrobiales bacterium]